MPNHVSFLPIAAMMFLAGIGIPIMAALTSGLGVQLGSPVAATTVSFAVAFGLSLLILFAVGLPERSAFTFAQPQLYFGAVFVLFYALAITWAAPQIGVGNAVFFVLLGQLLAAAAIDHFALLGAIKSSITPRRAAGLLVMALGVFLARKPL